MIIVGEADLCDFFVDPIFSLIFLCSLFFMFFILLFLFLIFQPSEQTTKPRKIVEQFLLKQMTISFL